MFLTGNEDVQQGLSTAETLWQKFVTWASTSGVRLLISILIILVTFKLINVLTKKLYAKLQKKQVDETISRVSCSALKVSLKVIIFVSLVGYVGIETASISALIASLGVGIYMF